MTRILLVGKEKTVFTDFAAALQKDSRIEVQQVTSSKEGLDMLEQQRAEVVVAATELADTDGLSFINDVAKKYPLINTALMSTLSPEDFHEETEGLGVFMQISGKPDQQQAQQMLKSLDSINALLDS